MTPLLFPTLPGDVQAFSPTLGEVLLVAGTYGLGILLLALPTKLFPIGEMYRKLRGRETPEPDAAAERGAQP